MLAGLGGFWLIFMHICWPNHGGIGTALPGNMLAWCFISGLCSLCWLRHPRTLQIKIGSSSPWLLSGAFLMSLPLLWSPSSATLHYSLPRIAGLWAGLAFLLTLRQCQFSVLQRLFLFYCVAIAGGVEAIIALMELFGPTSWLPQTWQQLIQKYGRMGVGVFQQVNLTSSFLALSLAITLMLFGMRNATLGSRSKENIRLGLLAIMIIVVSATLTLLYSRTGWLGGAGVVAGVYGLLSYSRFRQEGHYQWLLLLLPTIGISLGLGLMNLTLSQALAVHNGSNSQRLLTLYQTLRYALYHPIIGYGAGTYEGYYQAFLASLPGGNPGREIMSHPHNELLYQYAEGGFIALTGALCWCVLYLRLWWKTQTLLQAGALVAMLPVLLHTQVEYPFYYSVSHWLTLLLLLRLADAEQSAKSAEGTRKMVSIFGKSILFIVALYSSVVSFQSYRAGEILDKFESAELAEPEQIATLYVPWIHCLRYKQDLTLLRLIRYQKVPDKVSLGKFVQENQQWITVHPWLPLYENQIAVLRYLHDDAQAEYWLRQARLTMPWKKEFQRHKPKSNNQG